MKKNLLILILLATWSCRFPLLAGDHNIRLNSLGFLPECSPSFLEVFK